MLLTPARAADGSGEGNVKAAMVLNFMKFVEWPASAFGSPGEPIVLAALGDDPVAASLSSLQGKTVSGRLVVLQVVPTASELRRCHVLFVGASEKQRLGPVLQAVQGWPTLTISEMDGFAGRGGMIGFARRDDRIGFEINDEAARKAGLKVNAKLLYLGKVVRDGPQDGR